MEGSAIHISTSQQVLVETLEVGDDILTLNGPFNTDNEVILDALEEDNLDYDKRIDKVAHNLRSAVTGVVIINKGLLLTTIKHIHIAKSDGKWIAINANALRPGMRLMGIDGQEIPINHIDFDDENVYMVHKLDVEPNDTYYVNGILTHNIKGVECSPDEYCNWNSICWDPCHRDAWCDEEC